MPKLAANLTIQFGEHAFLDRFAAAKDAGFDAVEFLFPYDHDPETVAAASEKAGVSVVLFNFPPGNWDAGDRGTAALPDRQQECLAGIEKGLLYAEALSCPTIHLMGGIVPAGVNRGVMTDIYIDAIRHAADLAAPSGRVICLEPLNSRDMPGYIISTTDQAAALIEDVDRPNVRLQFDLYHAQIMEGDLITRLRRRAPVIGHVQIAGVPDRHEPDTGETAPHILLAELDAIGYQGWVGCEYRPRNGTVAGLGWAKPYLTRRDG